MSSDLRNTRRYPCKARFVGAGAKALAGEVQDLSPGGLCLTTTTRVEKGKQLHLEFTLPTGPVEAVGEVRWVKALPGGLLELGIRFVRISAASQKTITDATAEPPLESRWMRKFQFVPVGL